MSEWPTTTSGAARRPELERLRRSLLAGSGVSFAVALGLVVQHQAGAAAHPARRAPAGRAAAATPGRFFDQGDGYSFVDPAPPAAAEPQPTPVAETSVS